MVARIPHPDLPEPTREQREVAELARVIRLRLSRWVALGLIALLPPREPIRFWKRSRFAVTRAR